MYPTIRSTLTLSLSVSALLTCPSVYAEDTDTKPSDTIAFEEVVVTGTRVTGLKPSETVSPVDVFGSERLGNQAGFDLTDGLATLSPAFNTQRFPIADGTAFIRPANLRNLAPDQTLVLVNGKRRHRSALINLQVEPFGTINQGSQAVDFGLIPSSIIQRVEVLRDGASAQYGSDAIAGVINIILDKNFEGISLTGQYGEYYRGDGENFRLAGKFGTSFGTSTSLNVAAEYISSSVSSNGSARPDAEIIAAAIGAENVPFNGLGQRWGDPDTEGVRLFANGETELTDAITAYAFGSYANQDNYSGFFLRTPYGIDGVAPRTTLCDCDAGGNPLDTSQNIVDAILADGLNPDDYLTADPNSSSGYVSLNPIHVLFPGGYNPTFGAKVKDFDTSVGVRGDVGDAFNWDISGRIAESSVDYFMDNTINPSLGRLSPTSFKPGSVAQRELGLNADMVSSVDVAALASPLNIAFGAEYRRETYEITAGDKASYIAGPTGQIFGVGSDGFQGDSPDAAGVFNSSSYAFYLDLETDLTSNLTVAGALRYENFDKFGDTIDWKISSRLQLSESLALRGTLNTGFRAPTPGQANTLDVTTNTDSDGNLVPLGTFPVEHPAAVALGAQPLTPEQSFNITAGLVFTGIKNTTITVDYYNIDVNDRIALRPITIADGSSEQQALINSGVLNAEQLGLVAFFSNAFDTTAQGIDVAVTTNFTVSGDDYLELDLRHAYNKQSVDAVQPGTIDAERVFDLENQLPNHRTVFTATYRPTASLSGLFRFSRYSGWKDSSFGEQAEFGSEVFLDIEMTYDVSETLQLSAGARNITNNKADEETNSVLRFLGATAPISAPFNVNGGSWYLRAQYTF